MDLGRAVWRRPFLLAKEEKQMGKRKRAPGTARERWRSFGARAAGVFIRALEEGATVKEAAAAAGVHRSTPYHRRDEDPQFRAAWDAAAEKGGRPWLISPARGRRLMLWKPRPTKFTDERKEIYLMHFAATCDSDAAARAAGVCETTVANHRRKDPAFAEACDEALGPAYARMEAELARQRLAALERMRAAIDAGAASGEMAVEFERAMALLKRYDKGRDGRVRRRGAGPREGRRPSFAEAMAALEKKLTALGYTIDEESEPKRPDDDMAA